MGRRSLAEAQTRPQAGGASKIEVEVQVLSPFNEILSADCLQTVAEAALRHEGTMGQVTLVITDDQGIQALNRDFLSIDVPTDVLSFSAQSDAGDFVAAPEAACYLGDVIVSYPRAVVQASEAEHSVEQEVALLVIHGILHLLGYDHADEHERAIMWRRQDDILESLARRASS